MAKPVDRIVASLATATPPAVAEIRH
jgi:hypothetical protein